MVDDYSEEICEGAESVCDYKLTLNSQLAKLFHLRGLLAKRRGQRDFALSCLFRAVSLDCHNSVFASDLGATLNHYGYHQGAIDSYLLALKETKESGDIYSGLARALKDCGLSVLARVMYERALLYDANNQRLHCELADLDLGQGRIVLARSRYKHVLQLDSGTARAHCGLGDSYLRTQEWTRARDAFNRGLKLDPDSDLYRGLGEALSQIGRQKDAANAFWASLRLNPANVEAGKGLAKCLDAIGATYEAARAWYSLASALDRQRRFEEALDALIQAISRKPDCVPALVDAGWTQIELGRPDSSIAYFENALLLSPGNTLAHRGISWASHLIGDSTRGWEEFSWFRTPLDDRDFEQPQWSGCRLEGRTILIWADEALGDTIQFLRFIGPVKHTGARVVLECDRLLVPLVEQMSCVDRVVARNAPLPEFDCHARLRDIPRLLQQTHSLAFEPIPYLGVDPRLRLRWRSRLRKSSHFTIGITWAGDPTRADTLIKSASLTEFGALAGLASIRFVSLQMGARTAELLAPPADLYLAQPLDTSSTIADTAALILNLDLVITVDTMIAHLAGALGRPVWTLLRYAADWRWQVGTESTPWYPTMRLFRQTRARTWGVVFKRVRAALAAELPRGSGRSRGPAKPRRSSCPRPSKVVEDWDRPEILIEAEAICRGQTVGKADQANSLFLRGMFAMRQNKTRLAVVCAARATVLEPGNATYLTTLGDLLSIHGLTRESIAVHLKAVTLAQQEPRVYRALGSALVKAGLLREAIAMYHNALRIDPEEVHTHRALGDAYCAQGKLGRALKCYQEASNCDPTDVEVQRSLGRVHTQCGEWERAITCFRRALMIRRDHADLHVDIGNALLRTRSPEQALHHFRLAVIVSPNDTRAWSALVCALELLGVSSELSSAWCGLGASLTKRDSLPQAELAYQQALARTRTCLRALIGLGGVSLERANAQQSIEYLTRALEIKPQHVMAHRLYGRALALSGDLDHAWKEMGWPGHAEWCQRFEQPVWTGSSLVGRTILLWSTGGVIDSIQLCRYASEISNLGAMTILECDPALVPLIERSGLTDQVVANGAPLPQFDIHAPLISLPATFRTTWNTIPNRVPYLRVDSPVVTRWRNRLGVSTSVTVGLVWTVAASTREAQRTSIPFELLVPILTLPSTRFISLQRGGSAFDVTLTPNGLIESPLDGSRSMIDMAGLLMNLDLLISVDTTAAHLAGALGVTAWTLLPYAAEWRWGLDGENSQWYPTMRLFRQSEVKDWQPVIQHVRAELASFVERGPTRHREK